MALIDLPRLVDPLPGFAELVKTLQKKKRGGERKRGRRAETFLLRSCFLCSCFLCSCFLPAGSVCY